MIRYTSTAVRDEHLWRVQCDQIPAALSTVTRLGDASAAQREAAARSREAVARLKQLGLTGADAAEVLGVSPQRVSQLSRAS